MARDSQIVGAKENLKLSYGWPSQGQASGTNQRIKSLSGPSLSLNPCPFISLIQIIDKNWPKRLYHYFLKVKLRKIAININFHGHYKQQNETNI